MLEDETITPFGTKSNQYKNDFSRSIPIHGTVPVIRSLRYLPVPPLRFRRALFALGLKRTFEMISGFRTFVHRCDMIRLPVRYGRRGVGTYLLVTDNGMMRAEAEENCQYYIFKNAVIMRSESVPPLASVNCECLLVQL